MQLMPGKHAATRLAGTLNPKYQVHGYFVNLTVRNVSALDPVGQVDFGGSDYAPAARIALPTHRRAEDRYEWWDLSQGCYFVEFNETLELPENEIALLEPDERLLRAGASHPAMFLRGRVAPVETLLHVQTPRLLVKQNARISRVRVFRLAPSGRVSAAAKRPATKPKKPRKS